MPVSEIEETVPFQISPNPLPAGIPLKISPGDAFSGRIRVEFMHLNGQVFRVLEQEKTDRKTVLEIGDLPCGTTCVVRISDSRSVSSRLLLSF